jgi:hypothetical protein
MDEAVRRTIAFQVHLSPRPPTREGGDNRFEGNRLLDRERSCPGPQVVAGIDDEAINGWGLGMEPASGCNDETGSRGSSGSVKSEDCWIFSPGPHPLRVVF